MDTPPDDRRIQGERRRLERPCSLGRRADDIKQRNACPKCGSNYNRTSDTRLRADNVIVRKHDCECGHRFPSFQSLTDPRNATGGVDATG